MSKSIATIDNEKQDITIIDNRSSPLLQEGMLGKMLQLADMMANSNTLPAHFHGRPGDCLRVIELAHRIGQSPFAIADGCYLSLAGKLGMDGKTIASLVNSHPRIIGSLNYKYAGDKSKPAAYFCTVSGRLRGEQEDRIIEISLAQGLGDSKGARQRWEKDPDQMLAYYGARVWARRHAPEVIGGIYTGDELETIEIKSAEPQVSKPPIKTIHKPIKDIEPIKIPALDINEAIDAMLFDIGISGTENELKRAFADAWKTAKTKAPHRLDEIKETYDKRLAFLNSSSDAKDEWVEAYDAAPEAGKEVA